MVLPSGRAEGLDKIIAKLRAKGALNTQEGAGLGLAIARKALFVRRSASLCGTILPNIASYLEVLPKPRDKLTWP